MSDRGDKRLASASSPSADRAPTGIEAGGPAGPISSPLVKILEADVIPKLAAARGIQLAPLHQWVSNSSQHDYTRQRAASPATVNSEQLDAFLESLLDDDLTKAWEIVERHLKQDGALGFMNCCQDLLQPVAQTLGEMWEADTADFHQVTRAIGHLQALLRRMPSGPNPALTERVTPSPHDGQHPRVMLLPAAGEQHTLGISMLGRAFSDAGWLIDGGPGLSIAESRRRMARSSYDVLGISISCACWIESTATQIEELRSASRNRELQVLIGGPLLSLEPNLVTLLGADDSATNLHEALEVAAAMLNRSAAGAPC
ncbi:MAG: cobalamin B12-binding domain-containing protein [Pseudomonadota bacterium]